MKIEYTVTMYHETEAPNGMLVSNLQVEHLESKGWVDCPSKFKIYKPNNKLIELLSVEWKWFAGAILTIIGLYLAYLKL